MLDGTLDEGAVNCMRCEGEGGSAWKERVRDEYIIGLEEGVCGFDVVLQGCRLCLWHDVSCEGDKEKVDHVFWI